MLNSGEDGLTIVYLPISSLKASETNARAHGDADVEAIAASIREFGFNDPVGIWSDENIVVEGHGRILAAQSIGMTSLPCVRLDHLSDAGRRAYALAHNRTAELSKWDEAIRDAEIEALKADFDFSKFGFEIDEEPEVHEDGYNPVLPKEPRSARGNIWVLGRHRVMCGDSTCADDVKKLMGDRRADMLLTDPPYNVNYEGKAGKIENDDMKDDDFRLFLTRAFQSATNVMRGGCRVSCVARFVGGLFVHWSDSRRGTETPAGAYLGEKFAGARKAGFSMAA